MRNRRPPPPPADPGISQRGHKLWGGGALTYYLTNFPQKMHDNEDVLTQSGVLCPKYTPIDLCNHGSATDNGPCKQGFLFFFWNLWKMLDVAPCGSGICSRGRARKIFQEFANIVSCVSEASQYQPGSRTLYRVQEVLAFLAFNMHSPWYFFLKIFHLCWSFFCKCKISFLI